MSTKIGLPKPYMPMLYKKATSGKIQQWRIWVEKGAGDVGVIHVEHGQVGGKLQHQTDTVTAGKNAGKKNETTPYEQAVLEAESEWRKHLERKCYGLDPEGKESEAKRLTSPMLAEKWKDFKDRVDWGQAFAQPKLDGYRMTARRTDGGIICVSREGQQIVTMDHIVDELMLALPEGTSFDGELYVHGMTLQKIGSLIRRKQSESLRVQYCVYDAPSLASFETRNAFIKEHVDRGYRSLKAVDTRRVDGEQDLMDFQIDCIAEGYEGAMLRHGDQGYEPGRRTQKLLKVKTFEDTEFKIVGAKEGRGTHVGMAIFRCKTQDGVEFDVLAPGTHEQKREAWTNSKQWIGEMLTVKHAGYTKDKKPWHPHAKTIKETL